MAKYKTARGATVDLSQILAENEEVRAVGNMNVNARGDVIDSNNNVIESRNSRVKTQYSKQHKKQVVSDTIPTSKRHTQKIRAEQERIEAAKTNAERIVEEYVQPQKKEVYQPDNQEPVETVAEPEAVVNPAVQAMQEKVSPKTSAPAEQEAEPVQEPAPSAKKNTGGLAGAIAKARESKQEVMKTERQESRDSKGVRRI